MATSTSRKCFQYKNVTGLFDYLWLGYHHLRLTNNQISGNKIKISCNRVLRLQINKKKKEQSL